MRTCRYIFATCGVLFKPVALPLWKNAMVLASLYFDKQTRSNLNNAFGFDVAQGGLTIGHLLGFILSVCSNTTAILMVCGCCISLSAVVFALPLYVIFFPMFLVTLLGAVLSTLVVIFPLVLILLILMCPSIIAWSICNQDKENPVVVALGAAKGKRDLGSTYTDLLIDIKEIEAQQKVANSEVRGKSAAQELYDIRVWQSLEQELINLREKLGPAQQRFEKGADARAIQKVVALNMRKSGVLLVAAFSIYFVTIFGTFYDQPH
jgi:hypothetical protein